MPEMLLEVENLKKHFPIKHGLLSKIVGKVHAVDGISLRIHRNQTLGLVGESGCGKTTAGKTILKLLEPTSGAISYGGEDITRYDRHKMKSFRRKMQIIFQDPFSSLNPRHTVSSIKNMPASVVWGEYTTKSQFDTLMVGWEPTVGMDPDYTARCHSKQIPAKYGTGSNYVQYENPELDKLMEEGVLISDMEKRKAVYQKIQDILHEDVPFAPIFAYMFMYGKNSALKGYKINPYVTDITWNIQDWSWE